MVKHEKDGLLKTGRNRVHPHNDRRTRGTENLIRWEGSWLADPWTYISQRPLSTQSGKGIDRRELRRKAQSSNSIKPNYMEWYDRLNKTQGVQEIFQASGVADAIAASITVIPKDA